MFTLLVTLTVVVMAIAAALAVAISDPEQPAMLRSHPARDRRRQRRVERALRGPAGRPDRRPSPRPTRSLSRPGSPTAGGPGAAAPSSVAVPRGASPVAAPPAAAPPAAAHPEPFERAGGAFSDQWVTAPSGLSVWVRLRSGVVLTLLLAVVGALLAAGISGLLLLIALAVRDAVS